MGIPSFLVIFYIKKRSVLYKIEICFEKDLLLKNH